MYLNCSTFCIVLNVQSIHVCVCLCIVYVTIYICSCLCFTHLLHDSRGQINVRGCLHTLSTGGREDNGGQEGLFTPNLKHA